MQYGKQMQTVTNCFTHMQEAAELVGKKIAELCIQNKIEQVCFDRGGNIYHGRVQVTFVSVYAYTHNYSMLLHAACSTWLQQLSVWLKLFENTALDMHTFILCTLLSVVEP